MFTLSHDHHELQREAAKLGPGLPGEGRAAATSDDRASLLLRFQEAQMAPPEYLAHEFRWVERRAKLFEAGDYPDKGVSVSTADLVALESSFSLPVPVLIEHRESPLQLGYLVDVERLGNELFGTLALTEEADALLRKSEARSLSLGLAPDLRSIREVSLVRHPRIADAAMFGSDIIGFSGSLVDAADLRQAWRELHQEQAKRDAQEWSERYIQSGRVLPAQSAVTQALLACTATLCFEDRHWTVSELVRQFLDRQPASTLFQELVPDPSDASDFLMLPEEVAFYRRHFPDVELAEIARRKGGRA